MLFQFNPICHRRSTYITSHHHIEIIFKNIKFNNAKSLCSEYLKLCKLCNFVKIFKCLRNLRNPQKLSNCSANSNLTPKAGIQMQTVLTVVARMQHAISFFISWEKTERTQFSWNCLCILIWVNLNGSSFRLLLESNSREFNLVILLLWIESTLQWKFEKFEKLKRCERLLKFHKVLIRL